MEQQTIPYPNRYREGQPAVTPPQNAPWRTSPRPGDIDDFIFSMEEEWTPSDR